MELYKKLGETLNEKLLADPIGADPIAIPMKPKQGTVKKGTIVFREANGLYSAAKEADAVITNSLAVLDETIDTDLDANVADVARAYRAGRLVESAVKLAADAAITPAVKLVLRNQGIMLDVADDAPQFNNKI